MERPIGVFVASRPRLMRNLLLKDGDVLRVPQLPGWDNLGAAVSLKGEVRNLGVYGIRPGRWASITSCPME